MVKFCETVYVGIAPTYDRSTKVGTIKSYIAWNRSLQAKWCRLTHEQKLDIRLELNYYKICEMRVHPRSLKHNHYYEFMPETFRKMMSRHTARQFQRNVRPTWWSDGEKNFKWLMILQAILEDIFYVFLHIL